MYGYVRPVKGEMKVREYEDYRAVYCGLCGRLRARYGFIAGFAVNYDFTFMAMVLATDAPACVEYRRCAAHPFTKRPCACGDASLDTAAAYSVILARHKLRDGLRDEGLGGKLKSAAGLLLLRRAYRKARRDAPDFDRLVCEKLAGLTALEEQKCPSLDRMADCFAGILAGIASAAELPGQREQRELLYHLGRVIYLMDAADDLEEDFRRGRPNPLVWRFGLDSGRLSPEQKDELATTARHSINLMSAAWQLMDSPPRAEIIENIIYLGIPSALTQVLLGTWMKTNKRPQ